MDWTVFVPVIFALVGVAGVVVMNENSRIRSNQWNERVTQELRQAAGLDLSDADAWREDRRRRRRAALADWDAQYRALCPPEPCRDDTHEHQELRSGYGRVVARTCLTPRVVETYGDDAATKRYVDSVVTAGATVDDLAAALVRLGEYQRRTLRDRVEGA